ncbi:hypothetical protein GW915_08335 [bacterium]|nr:hypothetical protein [bacterium]
MKQSSHLKPQDILVALKLFLLKERPRLSDLAAELGLSQAEVSGSLKRAIGAGLSRPSDGMPYPQALREFVMHGLKYAFPAQIGSLSKGMPTAYSAPPLNKKILGNEALIWPDADGEIKGQSVLPIYKSVPLAAKKDTALYELLALIDALRVGGARERKLASSELEKRFSK